MKIIHRLVLGYAVVTLLICFVGYFAIDASQKVLQESIGENSTLLARETIDKVDRNIHHRIEEMQAHSRDLILQRSAAESNQEFEKLDNIQEYIDKRDKEWVSAPEGKPTRFMREVIGNELLQELRRKLPQIFESEEFEKRSKKIFENMKTPSLDLFKKLEERRTKNRRRHA